MSEPTQARTVTARGSLAAERTLLDAVEEIINALRRCRDLRRPAWVIVPTRVLRRHVQSRIVERFGATAGLSVWTLGGLVSWLSGSVEGEERFPALEEPIDAQRSIAADDAAGSDDLLLEILAARHLAEARGTSLERGRMPSAAIRDLLDAGLEIEHLPGLIEQLADAEVSAGDIQRAGELFSAAGKTLTVVETHDLRPARRRFARARQALDAAPVDPSRVIVYGFADLTGVGADFLQALVNRCAATVVLNQPAEPDPATPIPAIERYLDRWRSRLPPEVDAPHESQSAELHCFRAGKPTNELREVGLRIRALLDRGVAPPSVGVVLRQPKVYGSLAVRELRRLAIPCSAAGLAGEIAADGRRGRALIDLLEQSDSAPLSRWLDARRDERGLDPVIGMPVFALRRRLALAGLRTLGQLAGLGGDLPDEDGPDVERSRIAEAAQLLQIHDEWGSGAGPHHAGRLGELATALLWPDDDPLLVDLQQRAATIGIDLSFEEFLIWLRRIGDELGRTDPDPWQLGGVRLLRIQDAREVTFEHLFVPGMSRGLFPRAIRGDSELREELRERLVAAGTGLLPDLPTASRFHDEEKYLFAQVLSASPKVTLSHSERSLDERLMPTSSLLSLLPRTVLDSIEAPELAPGAPGFENRWRSLPPAQRRVLAGLWRRRLEGAAASPTLETILDEHDRSGPGPYLGWIGATDDDEDRRSQDQHVTTVERYAVCPWQTFVGKFLDVDERKDPDLVAPKLAPLAIGSVAHDLLAEIAVRSGIPSKGTWAEHLSSEPRRLAWPDDDELRKMIQVAARRQTRKEGIYLPGYAETLARAVEAVLARAKAADGADAMLLAVESTGRADLDGRAVLFRADRLEVENGHILGTDYKTGKAGTGSVDSHVGKAEWLQLPVYLLGGAEQARLLWLGDRDHPEGAEARASGENAQLLDNFRALATDLDRAWRGGRFFPRVLTHTGGPPRACTWCAFTEACSVRDPFARDRLQQTLDVGDDAAATAVWNVGKRKGSKS